MLQFKLLAAGYCTAKESIAKASGQKKDIKFYATYVLIKHPEMGYLLFDTGYSKEFFKATRKFPLSLYARATKVYLQDHETAKETLIKLGIEPDQIKYILISHFHGDHIGGLKDFPNARFICSKYAWEEVKGTRSFKALLKGFLPSQIPSDFESRLQFIEDSTLGKMDPDLGKITDLFGDGRIWTCPLEGHAKGQFGILFKTKKESVFLVADGAWLKANYESLDLPHSIVRLFFHSWKNFKESLLRIHLFHKSNPDTLIIPCHCEKTFLEISKSQRDEDI